MKKKFLIWISVIAVVVATVIFVVVSRQDNVATINEDDLTLVYYTDSEVPFVKEAPKEIYFDVLLEGQAESNYKVIDEFGNLVEVTDKKINGGYRVNAPKDGYQEGSIYTIEIGDGNTFSYEKYADSNIVEFEIVQPEICEYEYKENVYESSAIKISEDKLDVTQSNAKVGEIIAITNDDGISEYYYVENIENGIADVSVPNLTDVFSELEIYEEINYLPSDEAIQEYEELINSRTDLKDTIIDILFEDIQAQSAEMGELITKEDMQINAVVSRTDDGKLQVVLPLDVKGKFKINFTADFKIEFKTKISEAISKGIMDICFTVKFDIDTNFKVSANLSKENLEKLGSCIAKLCDAKIPLTPGSSDYKGKYWDFESANGLFLNISVDLFAEAWADYKNSTKIVSGIKIDLKNNCSIEPYKSYENKSESFEFGITGGFKIDPNISLETTFKISNFMETSLYAKVGVTIKGVGIISITPTVYYNEDGSEAFTDGVFKNNFSIVATGYAKSGFYLKFMHKGSVVSSEVNVIDLTVLDEKKELLSSGTKDVISELASVNYAVEPTQIVINDVTLNTYVVLGQDDSSVTVQETLTRSDYENIDVYIKINGTYEKLKRNGNKYSFEVPSNGEYRIMFRYNDSECGTFGKEETYDYQYYHKIQYQLNGGSFTDNNPVSQYIEGVGAELPIPNRKGYTFQGWYSYSERRETKYPSISASENKDLILYAKWSANPYTITYVIPNGTNKTVTGYYGNAYSTTKIDDPILTGYTFKGWYADEKHSNEFNFNDLISGDKKIYAWMELNSYNITFNSNGGSTVSSQTVNHFAKIKEPSKPAKEGYTFTGWYTNPQCTESSKYNFATAVSGPLTLYAGWEINYYDVVFMADGKQFQTESVAYNSTATKPVNDPVKTGYTFKGWYADSKLETAYSFSAPVKEKKTLYAKMELNSYTITFDTDGGSAVSSQTVNHFAKVSKPSNPTKEGYTFKGWYSDSACTNSYNFSSQVSGPMTIYAKWEINTYTVKFEYLNFTYQTQNINYNSQATRPADPSRPGYEFRGWYTSSSYTTAYDFSSPIKGNTTIYAYMYPIGFVVNFESNGGSTVMQQSVVNDGKAVKPEDPTRTGYTFAGWYSDAALTSAYSFNRVVENDMTLYAKWNINSYSVKIHVLNNIISTQTIQYQSKATEPDPNTEGYVFAGWYKDASFNTAFSFSEGIEENTDIYAKMERIYYDVSFNSNGGSAVSDQHIEYGTKVTKPSDPTRTGYTFVNWYSDSTLNNVYNFSTAVKDELTLYAKWTINYYDVTFMVDGSQYRKDSIAYSSTVSQPSSPSKTGYTFKGWYSDSSFSNVYDFSSPITGNRTIYGKYEINKYTVTFNSDGGSNIASQSVNYNSTVTKPANPTKTGYNFVNWYSDANKTNVYSFSTPITSNITLYASWKAKDITLTFNANGGNCSTSSKTVQYNSTYGELPTPTKDYNNFAGWFTSADGGTQINTGTIMSSESNVTVYAHWTLKPVSGWVLASAQPANTQVTNNKWTYTEASIGEVEGSSAPSGTEYIETYWKYVSTSTTEEYVIQWPSTYDTNDRYYKSMRCGRFTDYQYGTNGNWLNEYSDETRTSFIYWQYVSYETSTGIYHLYTSIYDETNFAWRSAKSTEVTSYVSDMDGRPAFKNPSSATNLFGKYSYRTPTYVQTCKTYVRTTKYRKYTAKESTTQVTAGGNISNVQHWVQYREK